LSITEDPVAAATGLGLLAYINFVGGANSASTFGLGNWGTMIGRIDITTKTLVADTDPIYDL